MCIPMGNARMKKPRWSDADIATLWRLYPTHTAIELSVMLNRTKQCVHDKAHTLGIKKCPLHIAELCRVAQAKSVLNREPAWTAKQVADLRLLYPTTHTGELVARIGHTEAAIRTHASKLKIRKVAVRVIRPSSGVTIHRMI